MPIYEYECGACGHRFELIQKFSDEPVEVCPKCGERQVQKLMSSPAIQFKGSGWYITDYARKGGAQPEAKPGEKSTSEKTEKTEKTDKAAPAAPASTPSSSKDKS